MGPIEGPAGGSPTILNKSCPNVGPPNPASDADLMRDWEGRLETKAVAALESGLDPAAQELKRLAFEHDSLFCA